MDENNKKSLTDTDAADKLSNRLRQMAKELGHAELDFNCHVDIAFGKVKQVNVKWPNGITEKLR